MPLVQGRLLKRPVVQTVFVGKTFVLRIDDPSNPDFWLTIEFNAAEFRNLTLGFMQFLDLNGDTDTLAILRDGLV